MKATVVLFFFLGMSSLLFCINPNDKGIYEDAYMVTNAVLKGSQVINHALFTAYVIPSGKHSLHLLLCAVIRCTNGSNKALVPVQGEKRSCQREMCQKEEQETELIKVRYNGHRVW